MNGNFDSANNIFVDMRYPKAVRTADENLIFSKISMSFFDL